MSEDAPATHPKQNATDRLRGRRPPYPDGGRDASQVDVEKRHRILRSVREQLERHPAIRSARGSPNGQYANVAADVNPAYFGRDAESASLRVTWQPNPRFPPGTSLDDRRRTTLTSNFTLHYTESSGFDCGVHLEPNPHIEGHLHYQERDAPDSEYDYDAVWLDAESPVGVLWEVLELLDDRFHDT
ncbi:hypothetical protein J2754_002943 [Halarchaeum solikamskense]|uniref:hypothetical protein n=1 Tax=Halarchaeum nitratireducens TaxID=489913 RepID=UPI001FDA83BE|nr:hypothetical protein [Halarchaeum solikamskense]MBP2252597.1 hypothetical protein [Halarchaeum solikamskense]